MKKIYARQLLLVYVASLLFQISGVNTQGQQQSQNTAQPEQQEQTDDDVVRISTDLVQTGVSVFDKKGRFVEGLKKEDFELKVDGKPVEIGFFERVFAGTALEETQVAAVVRGDSPAKIKEIGKDAVVPNLPSRGRVVVFFVDDIHIAFENLKSAKDSIIRFIDKEMGPNDVAAIASSTGQIGFLQQYTDNKDVLKMAVNRLTYRPFGARDIEQPIMTDGQAVLIDQGDKQVFAFFVGQAIKMLSLSPSQAAEYVTRRARILVQRASGLSKATLSSLETLSRRAAGLPGRKLIFFVSDGFPIDIKNSDTLDRLRRIVDASMRAGVVIYTVNSRGLETDMMDAAVDPPPTGRVASASRLIGEDILNALAAETGGRFIHNTNDFNPDLAKALKETSTYYLLAWRPSEAGGSKKFRSIKVSIKNRPELSVKVQRGYFEKTPEAAKQKEATNAKSNAPADPLRKAINSLFPKREIPTRVALTYIDTPGIGSTLVASMKVEADALKFEQPGGAVAAVVDITGTVFDAKGKALDSFNHRLTVTPPSSASGAAKPPDIIYNYRATLKPGLYQVRVAALDRASGRTGSAREWVEIPDLSKQGFSMSSLIVGERKPTASGVERQSDTLVEGVTVSVDRRFERSSNLRYLVYIYNAANAHAAAANTQPDVTLQVQIFRGDQLVVTMPPRQPSAEPQDPTHLAYAAEIPLQGLRAGQYVLQVTAIDGTTKARASQRVRFEVQ
jgi:VWFA-related protein